MAQQKIYVRGYMLNEERKAIEFGTVQQKGTTNGTTSNEKGFYELVVEREDTIKLVFSCVGYQVKEYEFATTHESAYNLTLNLKSDTMALETVEVKGYKRQTSTMMNIDTEALKVMPTLSGGIESLLTSFAGVSSNNEMSSQYSVRGGNYDENSVYVNGIEIYRPLLVRAGQQEGLSFINPDLVGSVNFSAGGFDAKYGDKMASVLDVEYKKPSLFEANATISLLGASAYVGSTYKGFSQVHGFRYKTSKYFLGTLDTDGEYSPMYLDYQTYMSMKFSDKWELSFLGNFSQNTYEFVPQQRSTSFGTISDAKNFTVYFDGMEKDRFRTLFGALSLKYNPTKSVKLSLDASAFNTMERESYDIIGSYSLSEHNLFNPDDSNTAQLGVGSYHEHARNSLSATVLALSHKGSFSTENNVLSWGISGQSEVVLDRINEWETRDSAGYSLPQNPDRVDMIYNLHSNVDMYAYRLQGYVQDNWKIFADHGTWSLTGGVRANYWSVNKEWLFSPRVAASFFPDWKADFNFRLAAGVYYQAPFYKELRLEHKDEYGNNYIDLNRNIKAQRSLHVLLGMDYYFRAWNRPFKLTTEVYYKPADRVISYHVDNVRVRYSGVNDAVAHTAGFDVKLFGEFVPGTDSWISFSYMSSKEDIIGDYFPVYSNTGSFLGNVEAGYVSRPNEQRYNVTLFFQDYIPNHPRYKVHLKLVWSDGLPFGPPHSERYQAVLRTKAYNRVDIGASCGFTQQRDKWMRHFKPVKAFWLNLELFNLFNIKNTNSYYWITDIYNQQFAVPNYLTGFMVNFKLSVDF